MIYNPRLVAVLQVHASCKSAQMHQQLKQFREQEHKVKSIEDNAVPIPCVEVPQEVLNKLYSMWHHNPHEYPLFVKMLFKRFPDVASTVHHAATGIAGEAGEVLDISKKTWANGKPLPVEKLIEELGDMRFYYQAMLEVLGLLDGDIIAYNMDKLRKRYPTGVYSDQAALERKDKQGE